MIDRPLRHVSTNRYLTCDRASSDVSSDQYLTCDTDHHLTCDRQSSDVWPTRETPLERRFKAQAYQGSLSPSALALQRGVQHRYAASCAAGAARTSFGSVATVKVKTYRGSRP